MPLDDNYFAIMAARGLVWRGERFVRGTPEEVEQAKARYGAPHYRPASELEERFLQGFRRQLAKLQRERALATKSGEGTP